MLRSVFFMLCSVLPLSAGAEDLRPVVVRHAAGVSVTDNQVRAIVAEMNEVMAAAPGCGEIRFFRSGAPRVSDSIPFVVNLPSHTVALLNQADGNILITHDLQYCSRPGGFAGCSNDNKNAVVELLNHARLNALVWLHEIGHSHTLSHVTDDTRLMFKEVKIGREKIITSECAEYVAANSRFPIFEETIVAEADLIIPIEGGPDVVAEDEALAAPESVLAEVWVHGLPTDRFDPLAEEADFLPALRRILMDEGKVDLWPNTVAALGVYGEEEDLSLLESFAGRDFSPSDPVTRAKDNIPSAIGFLSGKFASPTGLAFLEDATDVNAAAAFVGDVGDDAVAAQLALGFAQSSLFALALAEGEIVRRADLGELTEEQAAPAREAFQRGADRVRLRDPSFPVDPALVEEFLQTLDEVRARVSAIGQEAYIRSDDF